MNFRFTLSLIFAFAVLTLSAQNDTTYWKTGGKIGLTFSQTYLSNWSAGGDNALSGTGTLNLHSNFTKGKVLWENKLDMAYGLMKTGDFDVMKTDDKLEFSSNYGHQATEHWYYSLMLSFKSQFANGYDYKVDSTNKISTFLAPAYLTFGPGMKYVPCPHFSMNISPAAARLLMVMDDDLSNAGAFGVDPGDKMKFELGGNINMDINFDLFENVKLTSNLVLFSNYLEDPQNIDVDWKLALDMKINSFMNASINTNLVYDNDIMITDGDGKTGPRTQFKEVLGIGLYYNFGK